MSPEVLGLQILLSGQDSQVVPVKERLAVLKDMSKSNLKAHPRRSKITFDLVPFQNYPYAHIQIKNPLPQHPTHSPRVQGGLCSPWVQGVHGVPARGAGDTAELS